MDCKPRPETGKSLSLSPYTSANIRNRPSRRELQQLLILLKVILEITPPPVLTQCLGSSRGLHASWSLPSVVADTENRAKGVGFSLTQTYVEEWPLGRFKGFAARCTFCFWGRGLYLI